MLYNIYTIVFRTQYCSNNVVAMFNQTRIQTFPLEHNIVHGLDLYGCIIMLIMYVHRCTLLHEIPRQFSRRRTYSFRVAGLMRSV